MNNFNAQLKIGKTGESEISKWLQSKGYNILPIYEISEGQYKGPAVYTHDGSEIIAPDILAFKSGNILWIEAKHKNAFTKHRITNRWTTGIDLHHYFEYQKIQNTVEWPVCLLFLHRGGRAKDSGISPAGLFGGSLKHLMKHENHRHENHGRTGMVYWAIDVLKKIADYPLPDESIEARLSAYNKFEPIS